VEVTLDLRRGVRDADHRIVVKIALHDPAAVDGEVLEHHRAHAIDDAAFDLIFGAAGIDDLATDVADGNHAINLERAVL
jgi:hypothetical protein